MRPAIGSTAAAARGASPNPELPNPGVKCEVHVGEPLGSHRHRRALRADPDPLIRHYDVDPWSGVDQKVPEAVTGKPGHGAAVLPKRKPRLERGIARLTLATHGLNGAQTGGPFQSGSADASRARLHRTRGAT